MYSLSGQKRIFPNIKALANVPASRWRPPKPLTVEDLAAQTAILLQDVALGIGAKGPIFAKDKVIRVGSQDGLPCKDIWLMYVNWRMVSSTPLTNAPSSSTLEEIRRPYTSPRWSIEQCFKELKDYLGMDNYETRNWLAFHRYILFEQHRSSVYQ